MSEKESWQSFACRVYNPIRSAAETRKEELPLWESTIAAPEQMRLITYRA
jgi:hypothetical protein